jgi:hypothetical protein
MYPLVLPEEFRQVSFLIRIYLKEEVQVIPHLHLFLKYNILNSSIASSIN